MPYIRILVVAALIVLTHTTSVYAQVCPGCQVNAQRRQAADQLINLTAADRTQAENTHLKYGIPTRPANVTNERLLHHHEFVINYDEDLRVPLWAGYRLRRQDIVQRTRLNCFRSDPRLNAQVGAVCTDYEDGTHPGSFDRGHMVPRAAMNRSEGAMLNTFFFSNMAPQHDAFNRVLWRRLECYVGAWAHSKNDIHVFTGAVFDRDTNNQRDADSNAVRQPSNNGANRVAVPSHFYKILFHERPTGFIEIMTFLLPHVDSSPSKATTLNFLRNSLVPLADVQAVTGWTSSPL